MTKQEDKKPDPVFEEAELKAAELSQKHGCKVTPLVFKISEESTEYVVGYIKEPSRIVKLRVMDKAVSGAFTAAGELLDSVLIAEDSDPRIIAEDVFYIGAAKAAFDTVQMAVNQFAKK